MSVTLGDIFDKQVPNLVNKLIRFLGSEQVDKAVQKYLQSLKHSGPAYRDNYQRYRHPWWSGLCQYNELLKSGKAVYRNLSPSIELIAGDAKKIIELQKYMPESVVNNYRGNLLVDQSAKDFLFELNVAWHYLLKGNKVKWCESDQPQHEFTVTNSTFAFNVECKRISVDSFRKVKRSEVYKLLDSLLPDIRSRQVSGIVGLVINDRFEASEGFMLKIKSFILNTIDRGCVKGEYRNDLCSINLDMSPDCNKEIDFDQEYADFDQSRKYNEYAAITAKSFNDKPVDPVYFTCRSNEADRILKGIEGKLKDASKRQLDVSTPGIISVFIEDIDDFSEFANEGGLRLMTNQFFASNKRNHIVAVIYSSDSKCNVDSKSKTYFSQGLIFNNPNCVFSEALEYDYLS